MTELEIMERAKLYIDKMANGINPLTGASIPDEELLNNVRISRCLFYVSGVLGDLIQNGGKVSRAKGKKQEFSLENIDLAKVDLSENPVALSVIAERINAQVDTEIMKKITYTKLAQFLISLGMLEEIEIEEGKLQKRPTVSGMNLGISVIQKTSSNGNVYDVVVYNLDAQKFILDNLYGNV